MKKKNYTSLAAFVAARVKPKCKVCALRTAIVDAVNEGLSSGYSAPMISAWLSAEHEISIGVSAIKTHRRNHVKD